METNKIESQVDAPLYFLHLAKTAGTTLMAILDSQFEPSEICPAKLWHQLLEIPTKDISKYRLFHGHFYDCLESFIKKPLRCITFIRDPLERTLSHYSHIKRQPGHYFYNRIREQNSFTAFLQDPLTSSLVKNYQTRGLALNISPPAIASKLTPEDLKGLKLEQIIDTMMPKNMSEDEMLARAKARLDRCFFVGLVEQFTESLERMGQLFGWSNIAAKEVRLNTAEKRDTISSLDTKTRTLLENQTQLDYELYSYAYQQFK